MNRVILSFIILFTSTLSFGQANRAKLSGIITDSTQRPLAYATVSLFKAGTSQVVATGYSSAQGRFSLDADTGRYRVVVSYTGFTSFEKNTVLVPGENILEGLVMRVSANTLQGVTVTARKPLIEQTNDKIVYNAENDPASKTESASDILRKTPLVTVDGEGNVQLNGQSNFKILLNGRETAMFANNLKDALKNFPGALVTKVEVITSPSARYDAEGVGGVINIVTKKKVIGYNGYLSSYFSTLGNYSESVSLNVKKGKMGFTGYFGTSGPIHPIKGYSSSETTPLVPSLFASRILNGERAAKNTGVYGNAELSYEIDSFNTVTLYANLGTSRSHADLDQSIITTYASQPSSYSYFTQDNTYENPYTGLGADYIRKYRGNPDKEFDLRFNSQFTRNNGYTNSFQDNPGQDRYVSNLTQSKNAEYTFQADYTEPFSSRVKLETGLKAILRKAESDFQSLLKYNAGDAYQPNPSNTDRFNYHQEVYSGYASLGWTLKKYSVRLGARVEHTSIQGDFIASKTVVEQSYTNFIPNFQVSKKLGDYSTLVLSYNMRLQRPYITNLNPFVNNNDSLNISYGNPGLGPQVLHAVMLQDRFTKGKFFLALTFNASYTDNMIVQYALFNKANGVTALTSGNVGKELQANFGFNMSMPIGAKLTVGLSPLIRYNHIESGADAALAREGISGNVFTNFSYRVTDKFTISGSGGYSRLPYALTNTQASQVFYQVNFGYKFFNNKLATTVNFNNFILQNFTFRSQTLTPDLRIDNRNVYPYRVVYFGVTYNFGKLKESVSKKKGVSNDDLVQ